MRKKVYLLNSLAIIFIGKFASQIITLALLPLLTNYLSLKEYGLIDLIVTYVYLLVPILTLQMELAGFRFLVDARNNDIKKKAVISNILQIIINISALIVLIYLLLSRFVNIPYSNLILLSIIASIFMNIFMQFSRGLGENKKFAIASLITSLTMIFMTIIFVVGLKQGIQGVILAFTIANVATALYLFSSLKLYKYIDLWRGNKKLKYKLLHFSLPLIPNGLSWWVISVSDRTIISIFLGLAANGLYAVSAKYAAIYSSIFAIFSLALSESISLHINAKDGGKFIGDVNRGSIKLFGALGLILISVSPFLFEIFVGLEFRSAVMYVPILVIAGFFSTIVGTYSAIYIAKKLTKQVATTSILAALINIVMTITLIEFWGIYAAAIATAVAYLAMAIYRHYDIKKYISLKYEKGLYVKIGVAFALVCGLFYVNNFYVNIINLLLATAIALSLNYGTIKTINKKISTGQFKLKRLFS